MASKTDLNGMIVQIEDLREHLHETAKNKKISDAAVMEASHLLDEKLNTYYRLVRQEKKVE